MLGANAAVCPNCGLPVNNVRTGAERLFCNECGAEIRTGAVACSNCGSPVLLTNYNADLGSAAQNSAVTAFGRSRSPAKVLLIALIALNIIAALMFLISFCVMTADIIALYNDISSGLADISDSINNNELLNFIFDDVDLSRGFHDFLSGADFPVFLFLAIALVVFFVIIPTVVTVICIGLLRGYRITVTSDSLIGQMPFKRRIMLPINSIADVRTDIAGNIAVYCNSQKFVFKDIDNADEVCAAIRQFTVYSLR